MGGVYDIAITLPNVYSWYNIKRIMKSGLEEINSDHKAVYSHYSLCKTLVMSGIEPIEIFYMGQTIVPKLLKRSYLAGTIGVYGRME